MVYITKSNAARILRDICWKDVPDIQRKIYKISIFMFSRYEEKQLSAFQELMDNPQDFVSHIYEKYKRRYNRDSLNYVYKNDDKAPVYHSSCSCERLNSNYVNFLIPKEIKERGNGEISRFRDWFKQNEELLSHNEKAFEARLHLAFHIHNTSITRVNIANSGWEQLENYSLEELEQKIDDLIHEAGRYYFASEKNIKIIKRYSRCTCWAHRAEPLKDNNTGYSDKDVKDFLLDYEIRFKNPLKCLLQEYYRVKFNPDLEMNEKLLEQLGFRSCGWCGIGEITRSQIALDESNMDQISLRGIGELLEEEKIKEEEIDLGQNKSDDNFYEETNLWDNYGISCEKYNDYNGWSDDLIDDVFGGIPEATWNVD